MPIDNLSTPTEILARWRKAERQLAEAARGSPDYDRLAARVHDLAEEYRAAIAARDRESRALGGPELTRSRI